MSTPLRGSIVLLSILAIAAPVGAQVAFEISAADTTIPYLVSSGAGSAVVSLFNHQTAGALAGVQAWALSLTHDGSQITPVDIDMGAYIQTLSLLFWTPIIHPDGVTVSAVYASGVLGFYEVPKEIVRITYETVPAALAGNSIGTTTTLQFMPVGPIQGQTVVMVGATSAPTTTNSGTVTLLPAGPQLIRGDANGDGVIEPLPEAIFLSAYLFGGGPAAPCIDAIDINDDGMANVADIVTLLMWAFAMGPTPPPPFVACGEDPTPDALGCATPTCP